MNILTFPGGALVNICHPTSLLLMTVGVAVGIISGSIPGPSAAMAVALLLPLTLSMTPSMSMNLLVTMYIGSISGGLIPATLLSMPGTTSSIATCFDGHPVAKNRKAGRALRYDIALSLSGSAFSFLVLTFCAPLLADIALRFTPAENFGIPFLVLTMAVVLASGSMIKGVLVGMLGLIFALVGIASIGGTSRFTFGNSSLMARFDTPPTPIGIFTISEILITVEGMGNDGVEATRMKPIRGFGFTRKEFVYQIPSVIRSALVRTETGILPGIGGNTPDILSYVTTENMSKHPGEFGRGYPDGVVVTETASNATIGGAMIPLLILGIPGDGVTVMILGSFLIHGLSAGPLPFVKSADAVCGIFAVYMLCSLLVLIIEFFRIKGFVQPFKIPEYILMPLILILYCVGAYATNNRTFDTQPIILFGAVGYLCHKFKLPTTPFVPCPLVGEMVEVYLRHGTIRYESFNVLFKRPVFDVFFLVAVAVVAWSTYKEWRVIRTKKI